MLIIRGWAQDYGTAIVNPMDLGSMMSKLRARQYRTLASYFSDLQLVLTNCFRYNKEGYEVSDICCALRTYILAQAESLLQGSSTFVMRPM